MPNCALQGRQVCRDGGLRQAAAPVELAGADADLERMRLGREMPLRLLQPVQHLTAQRVGEGLEDGVEVDGHGKRRAVEHAQRASAAPSGVTSGMPA